MEISSAATTGAWVFLGTAILILAWWMLNWVWLRPKKLEKCLRRQGFNGNPYRLFFGDKIEHSMMLQKAMLCKSSSITDDCAPRVAPSFYYDVKKYGKNCFSWDGPVPRMIVMKPECIKDILTRRTDFQKQSAINPLIRPLGCGLPSLEGEKWANHRRIITPAFNFGKLKNMLPAVYQSCSNMINKWEELVSAEGWCELDVWPYLVNLTSDVISQVAFGSSYEEGKRIFELQDELAKLITQACQKVYVPGWRFLPTKLNKKMRAIDKEIQDSLKGMIDKRKKAMEAGEVNSDLLSALLESNSREIQENGEKKNVGLSIADVIDECKIFYFAGQETTSVLLVWTMVLLAKHTNWQSRARDEVLKVFGNEQPNFNGLNQLKVVTMILNEVMRLYPPLPMFVRSVEKETRLGNLILPAGLRLSIPIILVHHSSEIWGDDALDFKPERFAEGVSKATKNQVSFCPFGWGPRICIGQNLALLEAKMTLAMIFQRFTFELSPCYTHAPRMVFTIHPEFGVHLILHKLY